MDMFWGTSRKRRRGCVAVQLTKPVELVRPVSPRGRSEPDLVVQRSTWSEPGRRPGASGPPPCPRLGLVGPGVAAPAPRPAGARRPRPLSVARHRRLPPMLRRSAADRGRAAGSGVAAAVAPNAAGGRRAARRPVERGRGRLGHRPVGRERRRRDLVAGRASSSSRASSWTAVVVLGVDLDHGAPCRRPGTPPPDRDHPALVGAPRARPAALPCLGDVARPRSSQAGLHPGQVLPHRRRRNMV